MPKIARYRTSTHGYTIRGMQLPPKAVITSVQIVELYVLPSAITLYRDRAHSPICLWRIVSRNKQIDGKKSRPTGAHYAADGNSRENCTHVLGGNVEERCTGRDLSAPFELCSKRSQLGTVLSRDVPTVELNFQQVCTDSDKPATPFTNCT